MMMPTAMPQAMPAATPAVNAQQMAAQQQAFINQQAQLLVSHKTHLDQVKSRKCQLEKNIYNFTYIRHIFAHNNITKYYINNIKYNNKLYIILYIYNMK